MMKKQTFVIGSLLAAATVVQGGVQPLPRILDSIAAARTTGVAGTPDEVFTFFKENFVAGGYAYKYPDDSKVLMPEESGKSGEVSLCFDLNANEYSGGAVVLHGTSFDLRPYLKKGSLEFWIKGKNGGEICDIVLADDELDDGVKTEIKVPINKYGGIQPYWTHISIPLADFGRRGGYWNEKKQVEVKNPFNWSNVKEFLVTIAKGDNKDFRIYVDDVIILKDQYDVPANFDAPYWDEIKTVVPNHPSSLPKGAVVSEMMYDTFNEKMFTEPYGGQSSSGTQKTDNVGANPEVMAFYLDNSDYAGISLRFGQSYNTSSYRQTGGGIGFWGKAVAGVDKVLFGIHDDNLDGKSVGTSVLLSDYGVIDTNWNYYMIPLKEFSDEGGYWDETAKSEKPGKMDFAAIDGIGITADKYGNRIAPGLPTTFYLDKISLIKSVPGYVDPDLFWDKFKSSVADKPLFDFEDGKEGWEGSAGEQSAISTLIASQEDRALREKYGLKYLKFEYSLNDWAQVSYPFARFSSGPELTDWSKHRALTMDVFCDRDDDIITVKVKDAGKEEWTANVKIVRGWNKVLVPFRKFRKDPYYQVPGALVDGKLDLSRVTEMGFAPSSLGVMSRLIIDNITLTNSSND